MSTEFVDEKTRRGWQTKDVRMLIKEDFKTHYTLQHTRRLLHKIGMSWKVPRPEHKNRDPVAVDAFKKTSRGRSCLWRMNTKSSA
jgi:transposase